MAMCNPMVSVVMSSVPDSIERELILPASPARVWRALTDADQLAAWFGTRASVDLRPGGSVTFTWDVPGSSAAAHHNRGVIEVVDPPRRFAFRWHSGPEDQPMTLVDFTLEAHPQGTRLRLVESGFASVPPDQRQGNEAGWRRELDDLAAYVSAESGGR
jgi:uncharacterized protein YndB with AHSA1/START domain